MKSYIVAITGASGSIYGIRLVKELLKSADAVHLCVSGQSFSIIKHETGVDWSGKTGKETAEKIQKYFSSDKIIYHSEDNLFAPVSSGSFITEGMFVVPCSMKTLAGIANGYADNLIGRSADVVLKEGRTLVISPREMPFSTMHLENMLKLSRMGVKIVPPVPAFYHRPISVDDIIDFIVGKILDSAGISNNLFRRWG